eukprot:2343167-Rhodomonas_salina.2
MLLGGPSDPGLSPYPFIRHVRYSQPISSYRRIRLSGTGIPCLPTSYAMSGTHIAYLPTLCLVLTQHTSLRTHYQMPDTEIAYLPIPMLHQLLFATDASVSLSLSLSLSPSLSLSLSLSPSLSSPLPPSRCAVLP